MRLWSIHPKYLDAKGLVALWREALLARKVLEGGTKGYRNHPQLERFKACENPMECIDAYIYYVWLESVERGYSFDVSKVRKVVKVSVIPVTEGQVSYEFQHLLGKLKARDPKRYQELVNLHRVEVNPVFKVVPGGVEPWEKVRPTRTSLL
ncbi:pyrimidine dimer DNA glycosylase/endonuclease V [Infirmifilum sp. SLHALR2]|nr:MAG: hypothetical protein B7L53_00995 [Thermofilum sp. NZ13]